jgi:predicted ABC-type ATPase
MKELKIGPEETRLIKQLQQNPPYKEDAEYYVSLEQIQKLFNLMWKNDAPTSDELLEENKEEKAISFFIGAQSGAGKSAQLSQIQEEYKNNVVIIDGDEYRALHPKSETLARLGGDKYVEHTAALSSTFIRLAIARSLDQQHNVAIEGTMRNREVVLATMKMCKRNNYAVKVRIVAVSNVASYVGIHYRYEKLRAEQGGIERSVSAEVHSSSYNAIPQLLKDLIYGEEKGLVSEIVIYNRAGLELTKAYFDEDTKEFQLNPLCPIIALKTERTRDLNKEEMQVLKEQIEYIEQQRTVKKISNEFSSLQYFHDNLKVEEQSLVEQTEALYHFRNKLDRNNNKTQKEVSLK